MSSSSNPPTTRMDANALEFIPPDTLHVGTCDLRVGGVVYRLLRSLAQVPTRSQSIAAVEREVWGRAVNRNTLCSACRRARGALVKLKHPLRVAVDGDRIALV